MHKRYLDKVTLLVSKKITLLIVVLLTVTGAFAQSKDSVNYVAPFSKTSSFRTWSVAISGGIIVPFTDDYSSIEYKQPGATITIKNQLLHSLGVQMDLTAGQATGYNSKDNTYSKYKTQFASGSLSLNLTLANINWGQKQSVIEPYLTAGYGYMAYQPLLTTSGPAASQVNALYKQPGNGIVQSFFVPIGAGVKINVTRGINIDLGYTINFVRADDFDGVVYGPGNDKYSYIHAGVEFAIGNRKKPQLATHNPVNAMRTEYLASERSLLMQLNAQKVQMEQLKTDLAAKSALINSTNTSLIKFTTDSDGDGVPDLYDKCPNTPVSTIVDGSGCPLIISGGVVMRAAVSTSTAPKPMTLPTTQQTAPVKQTEVVKQPEVVKVVVTEQDQKVVKDAVDNLQFDFSKATIRPTSFDALDNLAKLLKERGLSLKLSGYTDNMGPDAVNLKISKDRAESVKRYLVNKGVSAAKIEADGYGKENPMAPNDTPEGRVLNRRVEFKVF